MPIRIVASIFFVSLFILNNCGSKRGSSGPKGRNLSKIETIFYKNAQENGLPPNYLIAVALYESDLTPESSKLPYLSEEQIYLGFGITETAFGLSKATLSLTEAEDANKLETQIAAYAKYIKSQIVKNGLNSNPVSPEDHYNWLLSLMQIHRSGDLFSKENRILWAMGLMDVMNQGKIWQNPGDGETVILEKNAPALSVMDFPVHGQKHFELNLEQGEIINTRQFELVTHPNNEPNKPTHIEVIHCPMNLSACIEIQNLSENTDGARLRTHYIVPQDDHLVSRPIQVTPHGFAVELTSNDGSTELISDAVVIMLVGNSGRYDRHGKRVNANPTWFTPDQLKAFGKLTHRVCQWINQKNASITKTECLTPGGPNGIQFHHQGAGDQSYQWGEIPDYDPTIFSQYVLEKTTDGEATFEFPGGIKQVRAGLEFSFDIRFPVTARSVTLERATRCRNGNKLVWASVQTAPVRGKVRKRFATEIYDAGPNGDGHHFFRVKVGDFDNKLIAWAIDEIYISGFEPEAPAPNNEDCGLRGG